MGCEVIFSFDFDAEEVWLAEDPANADRPGVLSQGVYGAKVGVPLILGALADYEVQATFFIPGRVAERHPRRVAEILAAGHEVAHHGYTHSSPNTLSREREEEELTSGIEALRKQGAEPRGYRSPSWDFSSNTLDLLESFGFHYSSNLMDDVRPYLHEGRGIVELPVSWILDDAPYFWFCEADWERKIATNSEVEEIWKAELTGIHELEGTFLLTMHPQLIGRPGRITLLREMLATCQRKGMRIMTCGQLAEEYR